MTRREALMALSLGVVLSAVPVTYTAAAANDEKIIISGASGRLGGLTVKALLGKGVPAKNLILVSRTPEALQEYKKLGADIRFGDFSKPESLPAAYAGGTRMLLISIGLGQGSRPNAHKRAVDAAKAAGVKQIAYTSWIAVGKGKPAGVTHDHLATEEILRKSGVAWTFLRNSVYMDGAIPEAVAMIRDVAQGVLRREQGQARGRSSVNSIHENIVNGAGFSGCKKNLIVPITPFHFGLAGALRIARPLSLPNVFQWRELAIRQIAIGAAIGAYSHIVLDSVMHSDIRPFAPFSSANPLLHMVSLSALHWLCLAAGMGGGIGICCIRLRMEG